MRSEKGAIMIESMFAILASLFVMVFLLSFSFLLYQRTLVSVVANEVAEEMSKTYKLRDVEKSSDITRDDLGTVGKYRYLFFSTSYESKNTMKAYSLANAHLTQASLAKEDGRLHVEVKTVSDDIGRRHYEVKISQKYSYLLGGVLEMVGLKDAKQLSATAYTEGSDVLHYVNSIKFAKFGIGQIKENVKSVEFLDTCLSFIKSITDWR